MTTLILTPGTNGVLTMNNRSHVPSFNDEKSEPNLWPRMRRWSESHGLTSPLIVRKSKIIIVLMKGIVGDIIHVVKRMDPGHGAKKDGGLKIDVPMVTAKALRDKWCQQLRVVGNPQGKK